MVFDLPIFSGVGRVIQTIRLIRWFQPSDPIIIIVIFSALLPTCPISQNKRIHKDDRRPSIQILSLSLKMLLVYIKDEDQVRCMFEKTLDKFCLGKFFLPYFNLVAFFSSFPPSSWRSAWKTYSFPYWAQHSQQKQKKKKKTLTAQAKKLYRERPVYCCPRRHPRKCWRNQNYGRWYTTGSWWISTGPTRVVTAVWT